MELQGTEGVYHSRWPEQDRIEDPFRPRRPGGDGMTKLLNVVFVGVLGFGVVLDRAFDTTTAVAAVDGNGSDLVELEDAYFHNAGDALLGQKLSAEYRERGEPGLALAALRQMSPAAKGAPAIQHEYALIYADLGRLPEAIAAERTAVVRCARLLGYGPIPNAPATCSEGALTRMELHLSVMEQLNRMGVSDPSLDPVRTREAFEASVRTARVASVPGVRTEQP